MQKSVRLGQRARVHIILADAGFNLSLTNVYTFSSIIILLCLSGLVFLIHTMSRKIHLILCFCCFLQKEGMGVLTSVTSTADKMGLAEKNYKYHLCSHRQVQISQLGHKETVQLSFTASEIILPN